MFEIKGNDIYITRGDSASFVLDLTDASGEPFSLSEGDKLIMTVKEESWMRPVMVKEFDENNRITFYHEDTDRLKMDNTYIYDIQYVTQSEEVDTIILGTFNVMREVGTWN